MTVLKKLSSAEAECVVERLTSWARLQLEDKVHISDEVRRTKTLACVLKSLHLNTVLVRSNRK